MKIQIPMGLVKLTGNQRVVEVEADTVRKAVAAVNELYPGFWDKIYAPDGRKRTIYRVFVDHQDIFAPGRLGSETPLSPDLEMMILYSPLSG
ncbi:MAG: molybdopterin synthase sulfur carrier subunit [Thermodesulfobacteriota bacterium]